MKESLELTNFLKSSRLELGKLLILIYGSCDSYTPDPKVDFSVSDEKELEDCSQLLIFKLQEK